MGLGSFLRWLRVKWFDLYRFTLTPVQTVPRPLAAVEGTGMKPTHSTGTSFEGYELCPFCVPTYVVDSTAMGCKSCACSNRKVAKKSNEESEVKYSPPGVGLSFTCCYPPLSHQTDGFQMLVDSGSSKYFVDPKLVHGVESTMEVYTPIDPPMEIKAAGHNTLFGIAQGTLLVVVRDTQDICRTVKLR